MSDLVGYHNVGFLMQRLISLQMMLIQFSIVLLLMTAAGQTKYIAYDTVNSICKGGVCGPGEIR